MKHLRKMMSGEFCIDEEGFVTRAPASDDGGFEKDFDELVKAEETYDIFPRRNGKVPLPGNYHPNDDGPGGSINYDPLDPDLNYDSPKWWNPFNQEPHTPETVLSHELMRAYGDHMGEPGQSTTASRSDRDRANERTIERANRAFMRIGKPPRSGY